MNKRKILLVASVLMMVAILGFGGTLAYLTDTETATNVFTTGNVDIKLNENFDESSAKLLPGVQNAITKEISITNTGSEDAYVRLHFAIPAVLDDGDPSFNASANSLHFNFGIDSMKEGEWNWHSTQKYNTDEVDNDWGYPENGGEWYCYTKEIEDVTYNVYVATWMSPLAPEATTDIAIRRVYLDEKLDNEQIAGFASVLGDNWKIYVAAEAVQVQGFEGQPYDAFNNAKRVENLPVDKYVFDKVLGIDYTGKDLYDNEAENAQ